MSTDGDGDHSEIDDLEIVEEPSEAPAVVEQNGTAGGENEAQEGDGANEQTTTVKRVRNPQPKLDAERLRGPRGLIALEDVFKKVKFKGPKREEEDLNLLMKTYEYWCHRLFPKFPFDNCLQRLEKLGSTKLMQAYIKKLRMDLVVEDTPIVDSDEDDANDDNNTLPTRDAFDMLLPPTQPQPIRTTTLDADELTEEQAQRIRLNREKAQQRRMQSVIQNSQSSQVESPSTSCSNKVVSQHTESTTRTSDLGCDYSEIMFDDEFIIEEDLDAHTEVASKVINSTQVLNLKSPASNTGEIVTTTATIESYIDTPETEDLSQCNYDSQKSAEAQSQESEVVLGETIPENITGIATASIESYIDTPDIVSLSQCGYDYENPKSTKAQSQESGVTLGKALIEPYIDTPDIENLSQCGYDNSKSTKVQSKESQLISEKVTGEIQRATESIQSCIDTPDIEDLSQCSYENPKSTEAQTQESEVTLEKAIPETITGENQVTTASIESYTDTPDIEDLSQCDYDNSKSTEVQSKESQEFQIVTASIEPYIDTPDIEDLSPCNAITDVQSSSQDSGYRCSSSLDKDDGQNYTETESQESEVLFRGSIPETDTLEIQNNKAIIESCVDTTDNAQQTPVADFKNNSQSCFLNSTNSASRDSGTPLCISKVENRTHLTDNLNQMKLFRLDSLMSISQPDDNQNSQKSVSSDIDGQLTAISQGSETCYMSIDYQNDTMLGFHEDMIVSEVDSPMDVDSN